MPTALICCDKFKGSASSRSVGEALARGLEAAGCRAVVVPLADGGDGTLEVFDDLGFRRRAVTVRGVDGRPVPSEFGLSQESDPAAAPTAVVEVARACGLDMASSDGAPPDPRDARQAGSWGVGDLIRAALDDGAGRIILALGGSATTDAGFGMARALGVEFRDHAGREVERVVNLADIAAVDTAGLDPRVADVEFLVASDVRNPLCGTEGAARVFGPQKGLAPGELDEVDAAVRIVAGVVEDALGTSGVAEQPGAGAAGGLGFMALALLGAQMRSGVGLVLEETGFDAALDGVDLVVTGEGRLDGQTLGGKAPAGVAWRARERGLPVIAVCGQNQLDDGRGGDLFDEVRSLTDYQPDVAECIRRPLPVLERIGRDIGARLAAGTL
ncbi:glycerate kinase [Corynebacterium sp.]|uniref:glycerate kinase n=1 Tax=Corynebacterium sp. TaxID=1720 RepID=UPI0025C70D5C|nr:glycerate kinase [Corynebacterium sp.]